MQNYAGNVSKFAAEVHQADGVHIQKGVQETLQRHLCQHGRTPSGENEMGLIHWIPFFIYLFFVVHSHWCMKKLLYRNKDVLSMTRFLGALSHIFKLAQISHEIANVPGVTKYRILNLNCRSCSETEKKPKLLWHMWEVVLHFWSLSLVTSAVLLLSIFISTCALSASLYLYK